MDTHQEKTALVGIVGGGLAALVVFVVLRFRGLAARDILIFSPDPSPEYSWERVAGSINLQWLRSESVGHVYPTDSPGLATVEAIKTWSPLPIIQSWFNWYHPAYETFIAHVRSTARKTKFQSSLVHAEVGGVQRNTGSFSVYSTDGKLLAVTKHIIFAVGHGKTSIPEPIDRFQKQYPNSPEVHAPFEKKSYRPGTVLVIGDGITAATEWANALQAGSAVAALSRSGFMFGQPLQVPRRYFSRRGLLPFQQLPASDRLQALASITRGTVPKSRHWKALFAKAQQDGRLAFATGELADIRREGSRLACEITFSDSTRRAVVVDQVVAATGFKAPGTHSLLAKFIKEYDAETREGILLVNADACLQKLSTPTSLCAVVGQAAAWAVPSADSLGGMKIVARRIARRIVGPEDVSMRGFFQNMARWRQMVFGEELV